MVSFYFPSEPQAFKGLYFKAFSLQLHETRTFQDAAYPSYFHSSGGFQTLALKGDGAFPDGERRIHWWEDAARPHPAGVTLGSQMGTAVQIPHFTDVAQVGAQGEAQRVPAPLSKATLGPSTQQD